MRKIKSEYILNKEKTETFKLMMSEVSKVYGVYKYKDYFIIFDEDLKTNLKHISVSRKYNKKIEEMDLENISSHFLGENYEIKGRLAEQEVITIHVFEIKIN